MPLSYNEMAGKNLHRLEGLSDGVFAVAMTLLVLDLKTPAVEAIHSDHALVRALLAIAPHLLTYLMSFLTLGIFWLGQQAQFNLLSRANRELTWLHFLFLVAVTMVPFSTALLGEFAAYRAALLAYWGNIVLLGFSLYLCWHYSELEGLVRSDAPPEAGAAIRRRVIAGQSLYAFGALLCIRAVWWSVGFIIAVQIQYAVGLKKWPFNRI